jgi:hypothetical protein
VQLLKFQAMLHQGQFCGGKIMIRTITIGTCVSIQGIFVKALSNGRIRISVGDKFYDGKPVQVLEAA